MSRAYEALLVKVCSGLDRLIADTEAVGSKSDDPTTLQQIEFDLDRWRDISRLVSPRYWLERSGGIVLPRWH